MPNEGQHGNLVSVKIDTKDKEIQSREYHGTQLKVALGVEASRELEQLVDGQLKPFADTDKIHIRGGEIFVSHVKTGGSS